MEPALIKDLGDRARCQGGSHISMIPLLLCRNKDLTQVTVGRLKELIQIIQAANPLV